MEMIGTVGSGRGQVVHWCHKRTDYIHIDIYIYVHLSVYRYRYRYIHVYICICVCMYVCVCVYMSGKIPTIVNITGMVYITSMQPGSQEEWTGMCMYE